jgi:hypothetical protein
LPDLPVLRDTHCPQSVVDQATRFLVAQHPDLLQQMLLEDFTGTDSDRSDAAWHLLEGLLPVAGEMGIPTSMLGRLDLVCEISRRLRSAYGRTDRRPR